MTSWTCVNILEKNFLLEDINRNGACNKCIIKEDSSEPLHFKKDVDQCKEVSRVQQITRVLET